MLKRQLDDLRESVPGKNFDWPRAGVSVILPGTVRFLLKTLVMALGFAITWSSYL